MMAILPTVGGVGGRTGGSGRRLSRPKWTSTAQSSGSSATTWRRFRQALVAAESLLNRASDAPKPAPGTGTDVKLTAPSARQRRRTGRGSPREDSSVSEASCLREVSGVANAHRGQPRTLEADAGRDRPNEVEVQFARHLVTLTKRLRQLSRRMGGIEVSKTNLGGAVNARRTRGRAGLELELAADRAR
jgi:hypothetical protein